VDFLSLVGNTPLIELKHCVPKPGVRLFAKLEGQNPTGSIKDRIVAFMLAEARRTGRLRPGQVIVEASTGNTGIALAMIGRRLGYPVRVVAPDTIYPGVARMLRMYGADVDWVAGARGIERAMDRAREMAEHESAFLLNQFGSLDNPRCHYETTAVEILAACPHVDAFVCGLGTGGTIMGIGQRLKEANPEVQLVAAEAFPGDQLQGLQSMTSGYLPPILDLSVPDSKILVNAANAFRAVHEILAREGIVVGPSSGAVMHAARQWVQRIERGNIVLMFADSGWKYLNSPNLEPDKLPADEGTLDDVLWW